MTTTSTSLPKTNCLVSALCCLVFAHCDQAVNIPGEKILTYAQPESKKATVLASRPLKDLQYIKAPYSIGIADSILIVLDKSSPRLVNLYGPGNYRLLADFGRKGEAPWNLESPWYYGQSFSEKDSLYCMISDTKNNKLHKINISNLLSAKEDRSLAWSAWLPRAIILGFNSVYLTRDSLLIGSYRGHANANTGRFFRYDIKTGKLDWSPYYPKIGQEVKSEQMSWLYYSFCGFNNEQQLMAASMNLFDRLDIVDKDIHPVVSALPKNTSYMPSVENLPANRQTKIFFNEVYTTDRFIYALKFDDKLGNYINNTGNMKLCIFTWDGALKKVVELDRAALGKLAVDEKRKKAIIINFCRDKDAAPLVEYDLSSLKIYGE